MTCKLKGSLGINDTETGKMFDIDPATYGAGQADTAYSRGTKASLIDLTESDWNDPKVRKRELVLKAKMVMWPSESFDPPGVKHNVRMFFLNSADETWGKDDAVPYIYKYGLNWWRPTSANNDIEFPGDSWPNAYADEATPNTWDTPEGPTPNHSLAGPGTLGEVRVDITDKSFDWLSTLYFMGQFTYGRPFYTGLYYGRVIVDIYSCFLELTRSEGNNASATLSSCG